MKLRFLAVFAVLILAPLTQGGQTSTPNQDGSITVFEDWEDVDILTSEPGRGFFDKVESGSVTTTVKSNAGVNAGGYNETRGLSMSNNGLSSVYTGIQGEESACAMTVEFWWKTTVTSSSHRFLLTTNPNFVATTGVGISADGFARFNNAGSALFTPVANTWYHIRIDTFCDGTATVSELTTESQVSGTAGSGNILAYTSGSASSVTMSVDRLSWTYTPIDGDAWCPDPGDNTNLGFNYRTNVNYESGQPGLGITTTGGYHFLATQTQTAYAAKVFDTTTSDAELHLRLEAGTEGQESVFEAYFLTQDPTTYLGGTEVLDATDVPDSGTGGILDDAVIVRFTEVSNDWRIAVLQNVAGSITQVGPAVTTGDPNVPTNFILKRDASIGGYLQVIIDGTQVMERYPDPEQPITGFVLRSTGSGTIIESRTVVDDQSASFASSCFFANDVNTLTPVGNQGTDVGDPVPDSPTPPASGGVVGGGSPLDPTDAGEAFGVGADAMAWFFGILFTIMISAALYTVKPGLALAGIPLGIGGAVSFGYIPIWFVFFLFMLAAAAVVLRFKTSGGES